MTEVYNILREEKLTPNQLYLLHCVKDKIADPRWPPGHPDYRKLKVDSWVLGNNELSAKSKALIKKVDGYFKVRKKKTSTAIMGDSFKENITCYNEMYPNMRLPSKVPARSSMSQLEPRFRWFFENHEYSWDIVMRATEMYLTERELANWQMTTCAKYFIKKRIAGMDESKLADFCELVKSGGGTEQKPTFADKVF